MAELRVARSELILGAQNSGKTRRAEDLAAVWLAQAPSHRAVYIATAQAWDEEMRERIASRRLDRSQRVPRMDTVEEPTELAQAIGAHSRPDTLIVVDCLTFWLTVRMMLPQAGEGVEDPITNALQQCRGPIILISNEIGSGVMPMVQDASNFLDTLGGLNQQAAAACERVTLMTASGALCLKGAP